MPDNDRFASIEARVKQLESFLGHIHPETAEKAFQEFPKQVGDKVVYSAEEERALGGAAPGEPPQ